MLQRFLLGWSFARRHDSRFTNYDTFSVASGLTQMCPTGLVQTPPTEKASSAVDFQLQESGVELEARGMSRSACGGSSACRDSRGVEKRLTHKDSVMPLH